jgi:signal transduction histidine kinase
LDKALDELRIISRGLALPDLDTLSIDELITRAVDDHHRQTELDVDVALNMLPDVALSYAKAVHVSISSETLSMSRGT